MIDFLIKNDCRECRNFFLTPRWLYPPTVICRQCRSGIDLDDSPYAHRLHAVHATTALKDEWMMMSLCYTGLSRAVEVARRNLGLRFPKIRVVRDDKTIVWYNGLMGEHGVLDSDFYIRKRIK